MSAPFDLLAPTAPAIPLVCDSPHSGTRYPPDFGYAVSHADLRRSEDTHVDTLWSGVPGVGGRLLCARFPRSYVDANRDEHDIDPSMLDAPWPGTARPSERTLTLGMGLIWRATPQRQPIYERLLTVEEVRRRIEGCWRPYREALAAALRAAARPDGGYWHLNLHSMPSNVYERLGLPARPAADVVLGDRRGTTCHPEVVASVAAAFRRQGLVVALNDPYEGADLVRACGEPARGRNSLQIELNRALYMDERTREPSAGFGDLQAAIGHVLREIASHLRPAGG